MNIDESYIERKKKFLFDVVKKYNAGCEQYKDDPDYDSYVYKIDEEKSIEENFCSNSICLKCGGCCKTCPCVFAPEDLLDLNKQKYLKSLLNTGLIGLYMYPNGHYIVVRPRGRGNKDTIASFIDNVPYQNGYDNECIFLGKNGCMLPAECRPTEGLLYYMYDTDLFKHYAIYKEEDYLESYEKYQDFLRKLYDKYENVSINIRNLNENQVREKIDEVVKCLTLNP